MRRYLPLFLISFATLFFELLLIRWCTSEIRILAYFKNIVLMAAVVGLGIGCACPPKRETDDSSKGFLKSLFDYRIAFLILFSLIAGLLWLAPAIGLTHMRFMLAAETLEWGHPIVNFQIADLELNILKLLGIFGLIVATCDCLGRMLGKEFADLPALPAYSANLIGGLAGIIVYGLCSYLRTPPIVWVVVGFASVAYFYFTRSKQHIAAWCVGGVVACLFAYASGAGAVWSPYYRIETSPGKVTLADGKEIEFGQLVNVNHGYHQVFTDFSDANVQRLPAIKDMEFYQAYQLPYKYIPKPKRVLVLGAGTGNDVSAALRNGAEHVDAVEIDPEIQNLGAHQHPEMPYKDPRVTVYLNDARNFILSTKEKYDVICFGYLDSQTAFSVSSSVRLDNYLYTMESIRAAEKLLKPDGLGVLSFASTDWIEARLYQLCKAVSPVEPIAIDLGRQYPNSVIFFGPGLAAIRDRIVLDLGPHVAKAEVMNQKIELSSDDWPFLYHKQRIIPLLYAAVLSLLAITSALIVKFRLKLEPTELKKNFQFFLLGAGFLLLETRGILAVAVLFGSTWVVTSIVIGIVLLMALLANTIVSRKNITEVHGYIGLGIGLLLMYLFPTSQFVGQPLPLQLLAAAVLVGLPFLFSGIVFSRAFSLVDKPTVALGINILGAVLGACAEYLSVIVGINNLILIAAVFYGLSFLVRSKPSGAQRTEALPEPSPA